MVTGKRTNTTVAPQALFMLNDAFCGTFANQLAASLRSEKAISSLTLSPKAYRLILNRTTDGGGKRSKPSHSGGLSHPVCAAAVLTPNEAAGRYHANTNSDSE